MIKNNMDSFKNRVSRILENGGLISRALNSYEPRPQQARMAQGVCEAIENREHILVEAGTGVGKSLAYLVPFILYAVENDKRVVVSTNTKTLQQQLCEKDLPFLRKTLDIDFNYALCLGSENYVCLWRLDSGFADDLWETQEQLRDIKRIASWAMATKSGIKADLGFVPLPDAWRQTCRDADLCLGRKCPRFDACFYYNARKREKEARILVVNHALFFANLSVGGAVLPDFDAVVFDEGHTLEEVATNFMGREISNTRIQRLLDSIYNPKTRKGILNKLNGPRIKRDIVRKRLEEARDASRRLFEEAGRKFGVRNEVKRLNPGNIVFNCLDQPLFGVCEALKSLLENCRSQEEEMILKAYIGRCESLREILSFILGLEDKEYVYWIEILERKNGVKYSFRGVPIHVAKDLGERLFDKIRPAVITSATLSANGNFMFIKSRLGLKDCRELLLDSPFNYRDNVLLYLADNIADPAQAPDEFKKQALARIKELVDITGGRTFILFTSYKMLKSAYEELKSKCKTVNLLKQGDTAQYELVNSFKRDMNSVLLGTNTFWQGVDVPGKALECVIITKLPFSVPDDPVTEARMEFIQSHNGNPFLEYQVPQAIMMFKQGFGRLIRTKSDRGVVAVLDPRIKTKHYGRSFLDVLPVCRHSSDINEVRVFFKN